MDSDKIKRLADHLKYLGCLPPTEHAKGMIWSFISACYDASTAINSLSAALKDAEAVRDHLVAILEETERDRIQARERCERLARIIDDRHPRA